MKKLACLVLAIGMASGMFLRVYKAQVAGRCELNKKAAAFRRGFYRIQSMLF